MRPTSTVSAEPETMNEAYNRENAKAVNEMAEHTHHGDGEERQLTNQNQDERPSIGEQLRAQRKARGISLVEISEHTKIGKKYLEALEEARYDVLPCETYIRGFLRAYAKYLEMDDENLIRLYKSQREDRSENGKSEKGTSSDERKNNQSIWVPLLSMIILAGAGAGLFLLWPSSQDESVPKPEVLTAESAAPGIVTEKAPRIPGPNELMTLKIKSNEKTWITVMADGRQEPDITLSPGDERSWTAQDRFVLWTGNAGGIEVHFNGELQPPLGQVGEVRKEIVFQRPVEQALPAPKLE